MLTYITYIMYHYIAFAVFEHLFFNPNNSSQLHSHIIEEWVMLDAFSKASVFGFIHFIMDQHTKLYIWKDSNPSKLNLLLKVKVGALPLTQQQCHIGTGPQCCYMWDSNPHRSDSL